MSPSYLYLALKALADATKNVIEEEKVEKAGKTIQTCAIVSAASGLGASLFPGGSLVLTAVAIGAVWTMYVKINKDLGISISDNTLKSLASAMLSNFITNVGSFIVAIVVTAIIGFIPALHILSIPAQTLVAYLTVFSAGILYIKFLTKMFKAKGNFDTSNVDVKQAAQDIVSETDIKAMLKDVKKSYKEDKSKIDEERKNHDSQNK